MKRLAGILLTVLILLSLLPCSLMSVEAVSASGDCGAGLTWSFDRSSGQLTISGSGEMTQWEGYAPWHSFCNQIKTVILPDGLTRIVRAAFCDCTVLSEVTIPSSVSAIGNYAFWNCPSLRRAIVPASVMSFGLEAFTSSKALTVYGYSDSPVERYAKQNGIAFVTIDQPAPSFRDVAADAYYAIPVAWAVGHEPQITKGMSETAFCPNTDCTRAEVVTFLWRASGCPRPSVRVCPFRDVKPGAYYEKAVLWAVETGVTNGTSKTRFGVDDPCTRAQVVTLLWRAKGSPDQAAKKNPFRDVREKDYYCQSVLWAVANGVTSGTSKTKFSPNDACTRGQIVSFLFRASHETPSGRPWLQTFPLWYGEQALSSQAVCKGNRIYVNMREMKALFGKVLPGSALHWPVVVDGVESYAALVDAADFYHLGVEFLEKDHSIRLYQLSSEPWTPLAPKGGEKPAYLRLEDIMADRGINGRFTHKGMMKLRFFGDYLGTQTDGFYIAWIPLYINPPEGVVNDISTRFDFYNADFIFTLDSLVADGGQIGLHGLSHQDHDSVSSIGMEFGPNNDLTEAEIIARFDRAKLISRSLGYRWTFFEFPHYASTPFQRRIADQHFDVIYHQDPDVPYASQGQIEVHTVGSRRVRWIPTPADYIDGRNDLPNMLNRLQTSHDMGKICSMFFHPVVDAGAIVIQISGNAIACTYDPGKSTMPKIIALITSLGYRFEKF